MQVTVTKLLKLLVLKGAPVFNGNGLYCLFAVTELNRSLCHTPVSSESLKLQNVAEEVTCLAV